MPSHGLLKLGDVLSLLLGISVQAINPIHGRLLATTSCDRRLKIALL